MSTDETTDGRAVTSRRTVLRAGAVGLAGAALASPAAGADGWDDLSLAEQLAVVRSATATYADVAAAAADGYGSAALPLLCGIGYVFDDPSRWDDELDPRRPESLTYRLTGDGDLELAALEYIVPTELDENGEPTTPRPDLFADEAESLDDVPLLGVSEADGWDVVTEGETTFWVLHVWVHAENPDGVFAAGNPRFGDMPGCVA